MGELDAGHGSVRLKKRGNAGEARYMRVAPDSGVVVRDSPSRVYGGRLHDHQTRATEREAAEVHEMKVRHEAVFRGVHAHG